MKFRYSNIAATVAVMVALSSGAYAVNLARGSVKTKHIKKGAVTKAKLSKNAVTAAKVKDGTLRVGDFAAGQIPQGGQGLQGIQGEPGEQGIQGEKGIQGLQGEAGEQGLQGEPGEQGIHGEQGIQGEPGEQGIQGEPGEQGIQGESGEPGLSELQYVREAITNFPSGNTTTFVVECPAGKTPISGGFSSADLLYLRGQGPANADGSGTADYNAWTMTLQNNPMSGLPASGYVYALCATVEGGFPNPGWAG